MGFGIGELIAILLGMQIFGVAPNPKAPTVDASLRYAIADADVVAQLDAASVVPGNYKALLTLPAVPAVARSPEAAKLAQQLIDEVRGPHDMVAAMTGIDLATDVADLTSFVQWVPQHDPNVVLAIHGKFTTAEVERIATLAQHVSNKTGGGEWVDLGNNYAFGLAQDGTLLAGTLPLVRDRVADGWKAPPHGAGTSLAAAAAVLAQKPVFATVFAPSSAARTDLLAKHEADAPNVGTDLLQRGKVAAFELFHDGMGWQWVDSSPAGLEAMAAISDGTIDLLRAAQIAPRGLGKIVLGGLESYRGNPTIDAILAYKADLAKLVDTYTGTGTFKAKVDKDPKALKLSVRLTGPSLGQVVPFGVVVPLAIAGALVMREPVQPRPPATVRATPSPALKVTPSGKKTSY